MQLAAFPTHWQLCLCLTKGNHFTYCCNYALSLVVTLPVHRQCCEQQSGTSLWKDEGMVFMACRHRVKYLCMHPPMCAHVVNMHMLIERCFIPPQRKICSVSFVCWLAFELSWGVIAIFGLQISLFTWTAACNSNSVSHITPSKRQTLIFMPLLFFFLSFLWGLDFCGCFWLELHNRGR